jgi:hypothetical protein
VIRITFSFLKGSPCIVLVAGIRVRNGRRRENFDSRLFRKMERIRNMKYIIQMGVVGLLLAIGIVAFVTANIPALIGLLGILIVFGYVTCR